MIKENYKHYLTGINCFRSRYSEKCHCLKFNSLPIRTTSLTFQRSEGKKKNGKGKGEKTFGAMAIILRIDAAHGREILTTHNQRKFQYCIEYKIAVIRVEGGLTRL